MPKSPNQPEPGQTFDLTSTSDIGHVQFTGPGVSEISQPWIVDVPLKDFGIIQSDTVAINGQTIALPNGWHVDAVYIGVGIEKLNVNVPKDQPPQLLEVDYSQLKMSFVLTNDVVKTNASGPYLADPATGHGTIIPLSTADLPHKTVGKLTSDPTNGTVGGTFHLSGSSGPITATISHQLVGEITPVMGSTGPTGLNLTGGHVAITGATTPGNAQFVFGTGSAAPVGVTLAGANGTTSFYPLQG